MTLEQLLDLIELTDSEKTRIISLSWRFPRVRELAQEYMSGKVAYADAVAEFEALVTEEASVWALDILYVCECFTLLKKKYDEKGYSEKLFVDSAKDIMVKIRECVIVRGDIGTVHIGWFEKYFTLERVACGRLQFGCHTTYPFEKYEKNGIVLNKGDLILDCHIPSQMPLPEEACFDAYRRAYEHYSHLFPDGIIKIFCGSYLLTPQLQHLFGANTRRFASDFDVVHVRPWDSFHDAWRIFDTKDISDLDKLPRTTSLQRRFADYMKEGGEFATAFGVIFFDGEKIVNK